MRCAFGEAACLFLRASERTPRKTSAAGVGVLYRTGNGTEFATGVPTHCLNGGNAHGQDEGQHDCILDRSRAIFTANKVPQAG
jgi:hypothetical protein